MYRVSNIQGEVAVENVEKKIFIEITVRPATHYQVDLTFTRGLPDSVCAHQVDLIDGPDQVHLSGLLDSECLA
jgi:hypothetical protein